MRHLLRWLLAILLVVTSWPAIQQTASANSGGLAFDGVDDYVTFGPAAGLGAAQFTLETWFYWTGGGATAGSGSGGITAIPLIAKGRGEADSNSRDMNYILGIIPASGVLAADFEEGATGASPGLNHPVTGRTAVTPNEIGRASCRERV